MRKQFVKSTLNVLDTDPNAALLLGDIGVFGFREAFVKHPSRVYNIGILEQATVGMAAGMAMTGMKPIVHTIAPFLIERAYEQLKIDFGYQKLQGTFVSVGGSFDYSSLGCTHHCPGDVNLIENIDGFSIFVPGHPQELDMIFQQAAKWGGSKYIRLSETSNSQPHATSILKPTLVKPNLTDYPNGPTVIAVGPCLDMVLEATEGLPATVYYTVAVRPFPAHELKLSDNPHVIVVEPYYPSQLANRITACQSTYLRPVNAHSFGIRRQFIEEYGDQQRIRTHIGFYANSLRLEIERRTERCGQPIRSQRECAAKPAFAPVTG